METRIENVVILITPFHKLVIQKLFPNLLLEKTTLVYISEFVNKEGIGCHIEPLSNYNFSRVQIFKSPFKNLHKTRLEVNKAKREVESFFQKFRPQNTLNVFLATDKDIFTQLFLNCLSKKRIINKLTLIDEGIGYYSEINFKDKVLKVIYRTFTPIFFGERLFYIKRLGVYPGINTIYLRVPELLPQKKEGVQYKKFSLHPNGTKLDQVKKGEILLFSFPNQDYQIEDAIKLEIIKKIALKLEKKNLSLTIKPHPREETCVLREGLSDMRNITILENNFSGEELNYFEFEKIINFFSSVILDILANNYPKDRLITFGFTKKPFVKFNLGLKYIYLQRPSEIDEIHFDDI